MLSTQVLALGLAASALMVSGCGKSNSTATNSSSATLTKAELIAKADAICARVHREYHANGYKSTSDIVRLAPRVAAYEHAAVAELRRLIPPASMTSDWTQIINNQEAIANATAKFGEDARKNDLAAGISLTSATQRGELQALATAKHDGFLVCSKEP